MIMTAQANSISPSLCATTSPYPVEVMVATAQYRLVLYWGAGRWG